MKKIKYINIIFFLIVFLINILIALSQPLTILDEMWNYNIARNISNGLIPYKEISMITTPLLGMFTSIFLKLIANELIVTRIINSIITTLMLYLLYKIMQILKINESVSHLIVTLLLFYVRALFTLNYNILVIFIGIIILYLELKNIEKRNDNIDEINYKYEFIIGLLIGIAICVKQSIGFLLLISGIIYNLIYINNKKSISEFIKRSITRILGTLIPIIILLIYLLLNNALYEFIDYCILGIQTFKNEVSYINLITNGDEIFITISSIIIPIAYLITIIKIIYNIKNKKDIKTMFTLFLYSITMFALVFPISDNNHFLIATTPTYILIAYCIYNILKEIFDVKLIKNSFIIITILILTVLLIASIQFLKNREFISDLNHFKYIPISESLYYSVKEVNQYINESNCDVLILDADAVIYMVPIDKYNKNYDMFNIGNFGSQDVEGIIEDLKSKENVKILIKKDKYSRNWQTPEKAIEYVKNNMNKCDSVGLFDVYK